jgi:hypothetical protein
MFKISLYLAVGLLCSGCLLAEQAPRHAFSPNGVTPRAAAETVQLATDGKALVPIVISPVASTEMQQMAEKLAGFLGKITGGTFVVERSSEPRGITLGTLKEFPDASLNEALKIGEWNDGKEAFAIRTGMGGVRLFGASDLASKHAAYRFLELLGVRRYFAGSEWEVIPKKPDLAFDAEEDTRPAVLSRRVWMAFGVGGELAKGQRAWEEHNRMAKSLQDATAHMYQNVWARNKEEFLANKEAYYAVVKGEQKSPRKFNLANPRVRELIFETAMRPLEKADGKVDMISIEPSDGGGWSESAENLALGTVSDRAFGLANELAHLLEKKGHPDVQVGLYAYFLHSDPPTAEMHPKVHVVLATRMMAGRYLLPRLKELWRKKTSNLGIYEYYSTYVWGQERLRDPGAYFPAADPEQVASDLDEYINDLQIRSFSAESLSNWALYGPGYYVSVQKMWDPRGDVKALLNDFYEKAFGSAEKPMREFYELLYPSSGRMINYVTMRQLAEKLEAAATAAGSDTLVQARINRLKQYMHSSVLTYRKSLLDDEDEVKALALEYYTLVSRTRESGMMATTPLLSVAARKELKFKGKPKDAPWYDVEPFSDEETEKAFAQSLAFLRGLGEVVEPVRFSSDLVAVAIPNEDRNLNAQAKANLALTFLVVDENPVTLTFNLSARKTDIDEVCYSLWNVDGKKVASGYVPVPESNRPVDITLPAVGPGSYRIELAGDTSIAYASDDERPAAIIRLPNGKGNLQAAEPFFYVPVGTREIIAHVALRKNAKLALKDSQGQRHEAEATWGIARIPVQKGEDGRLWTLDKGVSPNQVFFYNIPNIYSLNARQALLPREVAKADRLLTP